MFELLVGVFAIAAVVFLGAVAAVIRPYGPFGTRVAALRAIGLSVLCALAATFGAAILSETPEAFDPAAHLAAHREADQTAEAEPAPAAVPAEDKGPSRAERIAAEAAALAEARLRAEAAEARAREESPAPAAAEPSAPPPPAAAVAQLMRAIDDADWKAASLDLAELRAGDYDLRQALETAERAARAKVRDLPPEAPAASRDGYRLLAAIVPGDRSYSSKAESFAAAADRAGAPATDAVDRLVERTDPETGVVWLEHPDRPETLGARSTVLLAIGREGDDPPFLQMRSVFAGRGWIFVDSVRVSYGDEEGVLTFGWFERGQGASDYEWRDERPDPGQIALLRGVAAADSAFLRFHGMQESRDVPLSRADRQALADVLAAWDAMTAD